MAQHDVRFVAGEDPDGRVDDTGIADHRPAASPVEAHDQDAGVPHVAYGRVVDDERSTVATIRDADSASIAFDDAILDVNEAARSGAREIDADPADAESLDIHVSDDHGLARVRRIKCVEVDRDAGGYPIDEHRGGD